MWWLKPILVWVRSQLMMGHDFLKCWAPVSHSAFSERLGEGERVLNIPAGSWQFCLSLCFLLAQSLKVSQRALFFSGMCTALHMCDILNFQESLEDIEAPHEHQSPQLFLSGFWSPQLLWQPQATVNAKQLVLIVWASSKSSPIKTSPWMRDCQTGQIIKILQGWGVWGSSTPVCVL